MLTAELARELLAYDPMSGRVSWRVTLSHSRVAGLEAGGVSKRDGYHRLAIEGKSYLTHRVIWLIVTGEWPHDRLDHKNRICDDNRWENLRQASHSQNMANRRKNITSKSPYKGVTFDRESGKWLAQFQKDRKRVKLGRFKTPEEAHAAYVARSRASFGEFARAA